MDFKLSRLFILKIFSSDSFIFNIVILLGRDLGLPGDLVMRHPFPGPGLAIRIVCAEEPYIERDFSETQVIVKIIVEYEQMLLKVNIKIFHKSRIYMFIIIKF